MKYKVDWTSPTHIGAFIALIGLFSLPSGIIALVIGGLIGWGGMQLGFWISDRGW